MLPSVLLMSKDGATADYPQRLPVDTHLYLRGRTLMQELVHRPLKHLALTLAQFRLTNATI